LWTGSDSTWATPKDQYVYFSDFTVAITKKFGDGGNKARDNTGPVNADINKRTVGGHEQKRRLDFDH
jgi:hypothetical protein